MSSNTDQLTRITHEQALQFFEVFLIDQIRLTDSLEPNHQSTGRMEAYKLSLKALNILMKRCNTKSDTSGRADRSHVQALSENTP